MNRRASWFCGLLALASQLGAQERVGVLGAPSNVELKGVTAFPRDAVLDAVFATPQAWRRSHPRAERDEYLTWLRDRFERAYRWDGRPEAKVRVEPDGERVLVVVEEGERRLAAGLAFTGEALGPELAARCLNAFGALWTSGGPARGDDATLRTACEAIARDVGAESGAIDLRVAGLTVERGTGGRFDLAIELRGATIATIDAVELRGVDVAEARATRARLGFTPGDPRTRAAVTSLVSALERTGRFWSVREAEREPSGRDGVLVLEVEPNDAAPRSEAMPWDDLALLHRAVAGLPGQLRGGARLRIAGTGDGDAATSFELGRDAARFAWRPAASGSLDLGEFVLTFPAQGGAFLSSSRFGTLWTGRTDGTAAGEALLITFRLVPNTALGP
ncbi:MAG: hypothetical protein HZB39_10740 [Planctomycetes bacterium]|nr:hypothetical protein [Planctomycetota bacterium]